MPEKFYQLTVAERRAKLQLTADSLAEFKNQALSAELADSLVENQISEVEIPLGVCFIKVDDKKYTVPMATEEPSVIAAANHGAKLAGNFTTLENTRIMSGQIVFYDVADTKALTDAIDARRAEIHATAKAAYPSLYKRGGGLLDFTCDSFEDWLSVDCQFDTQDAMGANMINTMLEAVAAYLRAEFPDEKILYAILSNENCNCKTTVSCQLDISDIDKALAEKIVVASKHAQLDQARAATHNKGIMNGVEAIALAAGNDTRALAAANYTFAENRGLSTWSIENDSLIGKITLSLPIATAGGATHRLPKATASLDLLGNPDAKTLATVVAAVGLANNLAALKALVSEGIQKGHMALTDRLKK